MAKRAKLTTFDAMKGEKAPVAAAAGSVAPPAAKVVQPEKRGRGRPVKHAPETKVYGMTLRVTANLRKALRHLAEVETDKRGQVVSVHDVIVQAVESHLTRNGIKALADDSRH